MIFSCWVLAFTATLGSLFFSEIMGLPPCTLCWYQRICMYPLVVLFLAGLFPLERALLKFTFPLVLIGWFIALYHNLLYYHILPESASPCRQGVSCTTVMINWLGFVTIPLLSFMAFTLILLILYIFHRSSNENQ